jgi:hypothetical protein
MIAWAAKVLEGRWLPEHQDIADKWFIKPYSNGEGKNIVPYTKTQKVKINGK